MRMIGCRSTGVEGDAGCVGIFSAFVLTVTLVLTAGCMLALSGCAVRGERDAGSDKAVSPGEDQSESEDVPEAGAASAGVLTARQVLERSVENFMSLRSYRYRGTSRMSVSGDNALDSESEFDIVLEQNEQGAMDGHMVVVSREGAGSYETYSYRGTEYTRLEGEGWYRVEQGSGVNGYGMVSLDARRIIAEFARLVEDVRFADETDSEYIISMVMGQAYLQGAAEIVGAGTAAPESGGTGNITMTITVEKKTLQMKSVSMTNSTAATADTPCVTTMTRGTYSGFDEPVDLKPPPEALDAPLTNPADSVPTTRLQ